MPEERLIADRRPLAKLKVMSAARSVLECMWNLGSDEDAETFVPDSWVDAVRGALATGLPEYEEPPHVSSRSLDEPVDVLGTVLEEFDRLGPRRPAVVHTLNYAMSGVWTDLRQDEEGTRKAALRLAGMIHLLAASVVMPYGPPEPAQTIEPDWLDNSSALWRVKRYMHWRWANLAPDLHDGPRTIAEAYFAYLRTRVGLCGVTRKEIDDLAARLRLMASRAVGGPNDEPHDWLVGSWLGAMPGDVAGRTLNGLLCEHFDILDQVGAAFGSDMATAAMADVLVDNVRLLCGNMLWLWPLEPILGSVCGGGAHGVG